MMTNEENYIKRYFKAADTGEQSIIAYMTRRQPELISDMQDVVNRYWSGQINNILPFDKLNILRGKLRKYSKNNEFHGYCKLYIDYINLQRRIKYYDAMFISLLVIYSAYQEDVKTYYKTRLSEIMKYMARITTEEIGMETEIKYDINFNRILPVIGTSVNDGLAADAEYRIRQLMKMISTAGNKPDLSKDEACKRLFKQAQNYILSYSRNGNYTGWLDMTSRIIESEYRLKEFIKNGIEKVEFIAVIDNATTDICRSLHKRIFRVKDLIIGKTMPPIYPPYHPCRSVVRPILKK